MGGPRCSRRGPAWAVSGAVSAEVSVKATVPSRAGDGPEPGDALADNRAPGWPAGGRAWKAGAGERLRTPLARRRGARGSGASRQRSRCSAFRRSSSAQPVQPRALSPLPSPALPPTLQPALRAPRSGPRCRRPQPFIAAAASTGGAYWLRQSSPASSRRPTARQVEASALWLGLCTPRKHSLGLVLPNSGPFAPQTFGLHWRPFLGGLSTQKTRRVHLLCPAPGTGRAKMVRRYRWPDCTPSGGAIHRENWKGTKNQDFNGQRPGSSDLEALSVTPQDQWRKVETATTLVRLQKAQRLCAF